MHIRFHGGIRRYAAAFDIAAHCDFGGVPCINAVTCIAVCAVSVAARNIARHRDFCISGSINTVITVRITVRV